MIHLVCFVTGLVILYVLKLRLLPSIRNQRKAEILDTLASQDRRIGNRVDEMMRLKVTGGLFPYLLIALGCCVIFMILHALGYYND